MPASQSVKLSTGADMPTVGLGKRPSQVSASWAQLIYSFEFVTSFQELGNPNQE